MLFFDEKDLATSERTGVFAKNLRRMRQLREISQEELALSAGISRTYVSEVERAERNIAIDNMGLLAQALGLPLHEPLNPEMFKGLERE